MEGLIKFCTVHLLKLSLTHFINKRGAMHKAMAKAHKRK